ncbi:hypothetical protein SASPL_101594 [Salvia splendens]|uniref:Charged multivesicular body protein 7 n=1 Tax=Salvia splendens TaxID=180675 RepID=A0A8X9AC20_SALSN|nr:charged multivesicular body protein 7-like [Salvia splendens]KAG6436692.1 hypothetical protein SASPL_101594 [Salvia splendens]
MEEEEEAAAPAAFVRRKVGDWDDEVKSRARFKALSGQRSDWEARYCFWRDLIVKTAQHLRILVIRPSRLSGLWFRRRPDGLYPLCLNQVLLEMHRAGDLLLPRASSSYFRLPHIFRRALDFLPLGDRRPLALTADCYILASLLEERSVEVITKLSENCWTSTCVVTMDKFEEVCVGSEEDRLAILDYLVTRGRATRLVINKPQAIEGVKLCIVPGAASAASTTDCSLLHLTWTAQKLGKQLHLIDQRYQKNRDSALASLREANKKLALRHTKEMKLASQSRERCSALLDQVEKVLQAISDAESSKKVAEALQSSKRAMQENQINIEEVEQCLMQLDENIDALKRLDNAVEATTTYGEIDDEDIEEEFKTLQLELNSTKAVAAEAEISEETEMDALSNALSNLHLKSGGAKKVEAECRTDENMSNERGLEAA